MINKARKNLILNEGYSKNDFMFESASGSKLFYKNKKLIDLSFCAGSLILGHNSKIYRHAINNLLKKKISISASPNKQAEDFSKVLKKNYPILL